VNTSAPLLALREVSKRFGPVGALRKASLEVAPGEVVALLGENGAGKSTLMHIAAGMLRPDAGEILLDGTPRTFQSPRDARRAGIGMVHQHFTAIPALTVGENIALAAGWSVRPGQVARRTLELTERLGLPLDPSARAGTLPVALLQRLEIVKALATEARVLLLDEPTGVLAPQEVDDLLARVRELAAAGRGVVLITHKLDEALQVADRVVVLREGQVVLDAIGATEAGLASAMIGGDMEPATKAGQAEGAASRPEAVQARQVVVRVDGLVVGSRSTGLAVRGVSLEVRAGDMVAIAGVAGSGQRELLRALVGLVPVREGTRTVQEPAVFIPEDRTTEALLPDLDLTHNLVLGMGRTAPWVHRGWLDWRAAGDRTEALVAEFNVRTPSVALHAGQLSGGNQQKLVIARALARDPAVLVAENPTRGLDIRATEVVHQHLREAAARGVAVLVYSSDLDEVLALGQRVLVMVRGTLVQMPAGSGRLDVGRTMVGAA